MGLVTWLGTVYWALSYWLDSLGLDPHHPAWIDSSCQVWADSTPWAWLGSSSSHKASLGSSAVWLFECRLLISKKLDSSTSLGSSELNQTLGFVYFFYFSLLWRMTISLQNCINFCVGISPNSAKQLSWKLGGKNFLQFASQLLLSKVKIHMFLMCTIEHYPRNEPIFTIVCVADCWFFIFYYLFFCKLNGHCICETIE